MFEHHAPGPGYFMRIIWTFLEPSSAEPAGASKPRFAGWIVCAHCHCVIYIVLLASSLPSLIKSQAACTRRKHCDENIVFFEEHVAWTNHGQIVEQP